MSILSILSILFLIGTFLICIEFFIPGIGFFGILGTIFLILSTTIGIFVFKLGISFFISIIIICIIFGYTTFLVLKKLDIFKDIVLKDEIKNDITHINNLKIGDTGLAITDLKNFGTAKFNKSNFEVFSPNSFIEKGTKIKIVDLDGKKIIIDKI